MEGKKYLLSANYCGSLLLTVNVNSGWAGKWGGDRLGLKNSNPHKDDFTAIVPQEDNHLSRVLSGVQSLETDCSLDDFRQCAKKVILELLNIEKKLKEQEIGVNVAKTLTTFQGGLGAALCLISAPVGVAGRVSKKNYVLFVRKVSKIPSWLTYNTLTQLLE